MITDDIKKLEKLHKGHLDTIEKNEGRSFHQKFLDDEKADPGSVNRKYKAVVDVANDNTKDFMDKVFDHKHPLHSSALTRYHNEFGADSNNVAKHFLDRASTLSDAKPFQLKNSAYENNVFKDYRISTLQDQAFFSKFRDYMKSKFDAVGYDGDTEFIDLFWQSHPLSNGLPKKHTITSIQK